MRIVLFADNYIGMKVVEKLKKYNEDIVGLFIHPPQYQHYTKEIIKFKNQLRY